MDDNFSPRVKDVIAFSKEEALRLGHNFIGTEHLMLGILRDGGGKAIAILNSIEINLEELRRKVEILNPASIDDNQTLNDKKNLHLTRQAERALKTTFLEAKLFQNCLGILLFTFWSNFSWRFWSKFQNFKNDAPGPSDKSKFQNSKILCSDQCLTHFKIPNNFDLEF